MFKIFKRKNVNTAANPLQDRAAGVVVAKVLLLQGKFAQYMDRKVNRLSVRSKKFGLMVFIGLSGLICVSIVIETFTGTHNKNSLQIGRMRKQVLQQDEVVYSLIRKDNITGLLHFFIIWIAFLPLYLAGKYSTVSIVAVPVCWTVQRS